jgi:phosphate uptake regulator
MSIRKQYDSDLEALKTALVEMGQNAAEAVENALEALCTADTAAAQKIVQGDDRINNMERDIEHRCMTLLLRQQPEISAPAKVLLEKIDPAGAGRSAPHFHRHEGGHRY